MKILLIDNYDSFTYNLVHYITSFDVELDVVYNDQIEITQLHSYDKIIISPGPGLPKDAGRLFDVLDAVIETTPVLGVCLGFQAIIEKFGGKIYNQPVVKHGIAESIEIVSPSKLFLDTAPKFKVGLYHSWAANAFNFPKDLVITALSENDIVMAFDHKTLPISGVQFHPESILSEYGLKIVENFIFEIG
ncbi:anthranilate synthase component II [Crocinitomix catalasitica]|uniref:anthranilate synthase component II n=1 Tax=Crocinitomix catalasitica TaxID=184607 RepID=UPI000481DA42|nr:aminodeoxychorismate/anthranilate synthase component II [Crocinitomix catalasitica]